MEEGLFDFLEEGIDVIVNEIEEKKAEFLSEFFV